MTTDEEKSKIGKLLEGLEVSEVKLTERCSDIIKEFHRRFDKQVEEESRQEETAFETMENPYKVDPQLLMENDRKLKELLAEGKRAKKPVPNNKLENKTADPKRPWRTNSNKEKLLRIDNEIKRHIEKSNEKISPLNDGELQNLVQECKDESGTAPPRTDRLRETVEAAKKNLPNFQYRKIENSTATAIVAVMQGGGDKIEQYKEPIKLGN